MHPTTTPVFEPHILGGVLIGQHTNGINYKMAIQREGMQISPVTNMLLVHHIFSASISKTKTKLQLGKAALEAMGLEGFDIPYAVVVARVKELGLQCCPLETAAALRLMRKIQPDLEWLTVLNDPLIRRLRRYYVFQVGKTRQGNMRLSSANLAEQLHLSSKSEVVFVIPQGWKPRPLP